MPLIAKGGIPYWRHAVVVSDGRLYDIEGEVRLQDLIENYCWDNPEGKGGVLVHTNRTELEMIAKSDHKSFDERYYGEWKRTLEASLHSDDLRSRA